MTFQSRKKESESAPVVRVVGSVVWAAALAGRLRGELAVIPHPDIIPLRNGLIHDAADLVVIAATEKSLSQTVELLVWMRENRPQTRAVVVGPAAVRYRCCLLEAGAAIVVDYVWNAESVARIARRHAAQTTSLLHG